MQVARPSRLRAPSRIRILSIDGGGIYGLASAIWLRRLCETNPRFLAGDDVSLFAGTSSGAINSLLLARHDKPRDALIGGELERFWRDARPFQNNDPFSATASFWGVTGWFSGTDFLSLLRDTFGELKLGDLKHDVLISTFSWQGSEHVPKTRAGQGTRHWKPKFFANTNVEDPDCEAKVVDLAYAAAAPPSLRPIYGGFGDGATFSGSPVVAAIAQVVKHWRLDNTQGVPTLQILRDRRALADAVETVRVGDVLDRIAVLSLGSGQQLPAMGQGDVNAGLLFSQLPTNPKTGDYWPTGAYALDASTEEAEFVAKQLLGRERALRLNPPVLHVPTVMAAMLSRFEPIWKQILQHIQEGAGGEPSSLAITNTAAYLHAPGGWDSHEGLSNDTWTPQREIPTLVGDAQPALASHKNQLLVAYTADDVSDTMFVAKSTDVGETWSVPVSFKRLGQSRTPGLAHFDGAYWLAEAANDRHYVWTSKDGQTWSLDAELACTGGLHEPVLAANQERLILMWQQADQAWTCEKTPGTGWSAPRAHRLRMGARPSLAWGNKRFVVVFRGPEERTIWVATSRDGLSFSTAVELESYVILDDSPALAFCEGTGVWHMAWRREKSPANIWVASSSDGVVWVPGVKLQDRASPHAPALAAIGKTVLKLWRGTGERSLWRSTLRPREDPATR